MWAAGIVEDVNSANIAATAMGANDVHHVIDASVVKIATFVSGANFPPIALTVKVAVNVFDVAPVKVAKIVNIVWSAKIQKDVLIVYDATTVILAVTAIFVATKEAPKIYRAIKNLNPKFP